MQNYTTWIVKVCMIKDTVIWFFMFKYQFHYKIQNEILSCDPLIIEVD